MEFEPIDFSSLKEQGVREVILAPMLKALDLSTWTPVVLPQDIRIRIDTTGKGVLLGQEFSGEFDASFFFYGLAQMVTIAGQFTIDLA